VIGRGNDDGVDLFVVEDAPKIFFEPGLRSLGLAYRGARLFEDCRVEIAESFDPRPWFRPPISASVTFSFAPIARWFQLMNAPVAAAARIPCSRNLRLSSMVSFRVPIPD